MNKNFVVIDGNAFYVDEDQTVNIAPLIAEGDKSGQPDFENGISIYDVENWEGTRWEDLSLSYAELDEMSKAVGSLVGESVRYPR